MYTEYMYKDSLAHHGIKGQKWGVRRYQNPDGTLTAEGRRRYAPRANDSSVTKKVKQDLANLTEDQWFAKYHNHKAQYMRGVDKYGDPYMNAPLPKIGKTILAKNKMKQNLEKNRKSYLKGEISRNEYKESKDQIKEDYKNRKKTIKEGKPDAFVDQYAKNEVRLLQENPKGRGDSRKDLDKIKFEPEKKETKTSKKPEWLKPGYKNLSDLNIDYNKIYKEMGVNLKEEDNDIYRQAEWEYFKKHNINPYG